jgi:hypothetical protein
MVVIFMVMAGAFIPSGENVSPETVKAAYNKAVLTTCGVGVIYLLVIAAGIAAFPHRIQWGGDLRLAAAWVFFGLALLSKQIAVIFPFMLLLVEVAVLRAGRKGHMVRVLKYHALFLATLAVLGLLWLALQGQPSNPALPQEGGPDMRYFTQQVSNSVILKYVGLIFVPLRLNIDPDIGLFGERPGDHALTAQFAALMLLMVFAILLHKRSRLPAFGLFWFFLLIVPTCTFFKLSDIMAEHRVYLAGLGIFMAVGVAVTEAVRMLPTQAGRIAAAAIAALVIGGIILADIATIQKRNTKFWSAVTLWGDTIKNSPDKARPYTGVGFEYMNRGSVESVKGAFDAAKDALDKDRDVANPARIEAHRADFAGVDRDLRSLALNLAAAKAFLETGELYDQADLWKPKLLLMPDPRVAYDRFGRQQLSRVFNNLGVVYSYKSEMLGWQEFYAPLLLLKEKEIAADRGDAWAGALKYYALALGMNSGGVEALVNSSKIWWRIANNCYTKAQNDPVNRDEYLEQFQDDAAFAAALVLRAVIIRPDSPIALPQMVVVHYFMARYYYGPPGTLPLVSTAMLHPLPQEEREKRGLMHWRYFKWVSSRYPVSNNQAEHNAIMQMMMSAIMSLEGKYRDEPDPTAYLR